MKPLLFICLCAALGIASAGAAEKPNILFIAVDDLRPQLGCYGETQMRSPNIDRLAAGGVLFEKAYCQVPTCGASRASLLTGIRPAKDRFLTHLTMIKEEAPGIVTLPERLRQNGYHTVSNGKVTHHKSDIPTAWSEPAWRPNAPTYLDPANQELSSKLAAKAKKEKLKKARRGPAFEAFDAPDAQYPDGMIAEKSIADLRRLARTGQPFFLAAGFLKPHLPFNCPQKYWDLYQPEDIRLAANPFPPEDVPAGAVHDSGELRAGYSGVPADRVLPDDYARQLIHGYYACVSFTDAQIGRLLDELDRLGLAENTIVILWGDHGWNLGDHTMWCKHSCFESSLRVPLILRGPGIASGGRSSGLVEFIDIYPTFCDLLGIDKPAHLDGVSFANRLKDPSLPGNDAAFSRFGPGDTIRTLTHRFASYATKKGDVTGTMLYDHRTDPGENRNIAAGKPDESEALGQQLRAELKRTRTLD